MQQRKPQCLQGFNFDFNFLVAIIATKPLTQISDRFDSQDKMQIPMYYQEGNFVKVQKDGVMSTFAVS